MYICNVNVAYAICAGWFYIQLPCEIKHERLFQLTRYDAKNVSSYQGKLYLVFTKCYRVFFFLSYFCVSS